MPSCGSTPGRRATTGGSGGRAPWPPRSAGWLATLASPASPELEAVEVGRGHHRAETVEGPRPGGRDPAVVQVPTGAARDPDGALRRVDAGRLVLLHRAHRGCDLSGAAIPEQRDQLEDVAELTLRHLDEREVADRSVRTVDHEEVREVGHRDRQVGIRPGRPLLG